MSFELIKQLVEIADDAEFAQATSACVMECRRRGLLRHSYARQAKSFAEDAVKNANAKAAGQQHNGFAWGTP